MDSKHIDRIFSLADDQGFQALALETFRHQYVHNAVYGAYCRHLGTSPAQVTKLVDIPFLPLEFFKTHKVVSASDDAQIIFESSGTTQSRTSKHFVHDLDIYRRSFTQGFTHFYGALGDFCILALLPSYLERQGSSLILMADEMIKASGHPRSGFYLHDLEALHHSLAALERQGTKTLLIGVSFALLDLAEHYPMALEHTLIMETGGMKGRRKEMIRDELHDRLKTAFAVPRIHSEYGMTELLSQAYSQGEGIFHCPPWMKIMARDTEDPLAVQSPGKTGGINIIDLANVHSCSFLATQDLGKVFPDGSFEVLGRFDHSDVRGCNLLVL